MQTPQQFCGLLYTVANEIEILDFDCKIPNYIGDAMIKPKMLGHLVIRVRDAKRSEDFYHDVLGLEVRNRTRGGKMVFLTSNPEIDHEIALAELGPNAVGPFPDQVGLYHMAWELADMDELKDAYQVVLDNKVDIAGFGEEVRPKAYTSATLMALRLSYLPMPLNSRRPPLRKFSLVGLAKGQ